MGVLTAAEIIQQGSELAGVTYDAADTKPLSWLKQWLRSVGLSWPWPEVRGVDDVHVAAGEYSVSLGFGEDNLGTRYVTRVEFPIYIMYGRDVLPKEIKQQPVNNPGVVFPDSMPIGTPTKASYTRLESGVVAIVFNAVLKDALDFQITYQYDPAVGLESGDVPWYMNDDTMIHAIAYKTAEYHEGKDSPVTAGFAEHLAHMLRNDKVKFGVIEDFDLKLVRRFGG